MLLQGVESGALFQLVTGEPGSGKSVLLRKLRANLGKELFVAQLSGSDIDDFHNEIIAGFGLAKEVGSKVEFVIELNQILKERAAEGKTALLIIDDAQELDQDVFAELRMLIGLEKEGKPLLNLLLAGQPSIMELLGAPENEILFQKLVNHLQLEPFSEKECRDYIDYRLQVAGASGEIFAPEAVEVIYRSTKGLPGAINTLCTKALEAGAGYKEQPLTALLVERVAYSDDWRETLAADLQQLAEEKNHLRPTRESAAETAASVARAVKAAVSEDGQKTAAVEPHSPEEKEPPPVVRQPKKRKKRVLLWVFLAAGLMGLAGIAFLLYQPTFPFGSQDIEQFPPALLQQEKIPPAVEARVKQPQPPAVTGKAVSVRPVEVVGSAEEQEKKGRIEVHSLQLIEK